MTSFRDPRLPPEWQAIIEQAKRERARDQQIAVRAAISKVQPVSAVRAIGAAVARTFRALSGYPAMPSRSLARR
jgi:hypothetical protein